MGRSVPSSNVRSAICLASAGVPATAPGRSRAAVSMNFQPSSGCDRNETGSSAAVERSASSAGR